MRKHFQTTIPSIAVLLVFAGLGGVCPAQTPPSDVSDPPPDMKIKAPFTLAAVSDIQGPRQPITQLAEPRFQDLIKLLRDADISFANEEGSLSLGGNAKAAVAEYKAMGIKMMSLANNHMLPNDAAGILGISTLLDEAGIAHAGAGRDLIQARAPSFLFTPKGVVGLVAIFAVDSNQVPVESQLNGATYPYGQYSGRPGVNALHLTTYHGVTADQLQSLRKIRDSIYTRADPSLALPTDWLPGTAGFGDLGRDRVELFGTFYKASSMPGSLSYTMHPDDLREILRTIRSAKEYADFLIVTVHAHQYSLAWQKQVADPRLRENGVDDGVPDFLVDLAHQAIDNGADAFVAGGVHTMRGVEIYKGKPIFYGMSSFLVMGMPSPEVTAIRPTDQREEGLTGDVTVGTDLVVQRAPNGGWAGQRGGWFENGQEGQLATCRYKEGRLAEVRLYPVDLGLEASRRVSLLGIPMTPSPEMARQILEKIQRLSKPFGTTISIEDNVGVIRIPPN
jgi:poly-gamma-glutamate capsule biosynthesis protein CapA/YwtB (metallophosphatase superfamily)